MYTLANTRSVMTTSFKTCARVCGQKTLRDEIKHMRIKSDDEYRLCLNIRHYKWDKSPTGFQRQSRASEEIFRKREFLKCPQGHQHRLPRYIRISAQTEVACVISGLVLRAAYRIDPIAFWYTVHSCVERLLSKLGLYCMGLVAHFHWRWALSAVGHLKAVEYTVDISNLIDRLLRSRVTVMPRYWKCRH